MVSIARALAQTLSVCRSHCSNSKYVFKRFLKCFEECPHDLQRDHLMGLLHHFSGRREVIDDMKNNTHHQTSARGNRRSFQLKNVRNCVRAETVMMCFSALHITCTLFDIVVITISDGSNGRRMSGRRRVMKSAHFLRDLFWRFSIELKYGAIAFHLRCAMNVRRTHFGAVCNAVTR